MHQVRYHVWCVPLVACVYNIVFEASVSFFLYLDFPLSLVSVN